MTRPNGSETVKLAEWVGSFAEDKDKARQIRLEHVLPALAAGHSLTLDFGGVAVCTQSFVHALISEALRSKGSEALDVIRFRSCNPTVKSVILTVVEYSLEPHHSPDLHKQAP